MDRTKLPLGIQDFSDLIRSGYRYIDKTKYLYEMITSGKPYFISRPRRFGKSLTVSTLEAIFLGRRELFKGLWIDQSDWDWPSYSVIRLDMSEFPNQSTEAFVIALKDRLLFIAKQHQVELNADLSPQTLLLNLIESLGTKQQVVVLIDEYDKPIIDQLDHIEVAKSNRDLLRQFYGILKSQDRNIKFIFLTGVTKFAKVSVFSGLNNLNDLTMVSGYSSIMGYTKDELVKYFDQDVKSLAVACHLPVEECYQQIKEWYNGYQFSEDGVLVYNPFSVLKLFIDQKFRSHWFQTATPTFLLSLIDKRQFDVENIENLKIDESGFSSIELDNIPTLALLYQTGYLTIKKYEPILSTYRLDFPNREVSQSFMQSLIRHFSSENSNTINYINEISSNLLEEKWNYDQFFNYLNNLLTLIPYDLYIKQEKHFHSLFYLIIKLTGMKVNAEVHTQLGRIDAAIEMRDKIILFELKNNQSALAALTQIKENKYYQIYADRHLPVYLVGMNFSDTTRLIDDYQVENSPIM